MDKFLATAVIVILIILIAVCVNNYAKWRFGWSRNRQEKCKSFGNCSRHGIYPKFKGHVKKDCRDVFWDR